MANVLNTDGDKAPGFEGEGVGGKDESIAGGDAEVSQTSSGVHKDKRFLKDGLLLVPNMIQIDVQWKSSVSFIIPLLIWQTFYLINQ